MFRRVRKSAAVELSILLSNEPSEKAVGYFYRQNHFRSSSALENVSVHLTKSMDVGFLLSSRESDTDRHFKIAKRIKRPRAVQDINEEGLELMLFQLNTKNISSSHSRRFCVSKMKLLTSGDIELNPGPLQNVNTQTTLSVGSTILLNFR